ncbi:MAG: ATP-dependent helicase HrpB [Candidatus Obscuribacterales bacterium]|nr:ATP-dependent helicase HrpB [Candidatus Obscuribacterales bacterium]
MTKPVLPIDDVLPRIVNSLKDAGAVVLKAEPGAGKTTRVPPALLDAEMALLQNGTEAQIVVLQSRRIAARAAATRIAQERNCELGQEIGYQVRYENRSSKATRILVCTEGVFLRRLQNDPLMENIAAVVFDEFHERSIDSDLALALCKQVKEQLRPDLKIVVMSATLSSEPISQYLWNCPIVESPGRTFPVETEYLQQAVSSKESIERTAVDGIKRTLDRTERDILVFLPGQAEIRQTAFLLEEQLRLDEKNVILPLYGEMSLDEQRRVLDPSTRRKIILSTNVAETSLTIDGVTAVVDSGYARVNKFDPRLGMNSLHLSRISKASAIQRAGRAGRSAPGYCLRLWTEREHLSLPDFNLPEIARVELSECLLQLMLWGERDLANFPWFEAPPQAALDQALSLLDKLDASSNGMITDLGKSMAQLPLQPRMARLLVEGERLGCSERAALCAAVLSERDPFKRQQNFKATHHTNSDLLNRVAALEDYEESGIREHFGMELITGASKQILRARDQLAKLIKSKSKAKHPVQAQQDDTPLLKSILVSFPDRVCRRREAKGNRAVMVGGRGVRIAEESGVLDANLFVAVELIDSGQSDSLVKQASVIEEDWLPSSHLSTDIEVQYDPSRERVIAFKRKRFCDLTLDESPTAPPANLDLGSVLAEAVQIHCDLETLVDEESKQFLTRLHCLQEWLPNEELPNFGDAPWKKLLPEWTAGCTSVQELRDRSLLPYLQMHLSREQLALLESEAPPTILMPNGRRAKLVYEIGKQPILSARIQEFFGMHETPKIARNQVSVLLHLLAPNYRIQQITPDLSSFWKNTYAEVRKELKGRYPKHAWPTNPLEKPEPREKK